MKKQQYYSIERIKKEKATYNVIFGERSNGKTFSVQEEGLKNYCEKGKQMALIRRWADDFTGKRGQETFKAIVNEGLVKKYSNGQWDRIKYQSSRWYLAKYDEELDKIITDVEPFCYAFALNTGEHDKSTSYPNVTTVLFDEFLTRKAYLNDEFILFMNQLSTIIRQREDVIIYMCGNTVNQFSPYFAEMGLTNILKMKKGSIDVYQYGENGELRVAVEYSDNPEKKKKSDFYFAFDNPKLSMITGGDWEIALYPHLPFGFEEKDVIFSYYMIFSDIYLQGDIIRKGNDLFTFIHRKKPYIKIPNEDLVFSQEYSPKPNYFRRINKPDNELCRKIWYFYKAEKVFYSDNTVGEIVRNYLQWCETDRGIL